MGRYSVEFRFAQTALQKARAQVRGRMHGPEYPTLHALLETAPLRTPPNIPGHIKRLKRESGRGNSERRMLGEFYSAYHNSQKKLTHLPLFGTRVTTVGMRFVERQLQFMARGMTESEAFQACEHLYDVEHAENEDKDAMKIKTAEQKEHEAKQKQAEEWLAKREEKEKKIFGDNDKPGFSNDKPGFDF